ncbi:PEGA domain-containing protein [Sandaracinus amylolyticus]|uniref:PEGA domain-containing protein n=1 Tax=Sandaracinus amylolyticus TaxID=927083 RepID=UPI001F209871|nr:PEGA domain-containing protein [Sandaracinus amylolyticus]UJR79577.1 PEGA domain-containing protein [Sandaracinus amylolyticus]
MTRAFAITLVLALAVASSAHAQDAPATDTAPSTDELRTLEARTLFEQGVRASRDERWAEALDAFRRSRALVARPSTLFNIAIALDRLGRLRAAIAAIDEYLATSDPVADEVDRREAMRLRVDAEARLARITVRVDPDDATVALDGAPLEGGAERTTIADPGDHVVVVSAPGYVDQRHEIALRPGADVERVIELAPVEPAAPTTSLATTMPVEAPARDEDTSLIEDPIFWAILGGGAALVAGVAIGVGVHVASAPTPYGGSLGVTFEVP